MEVCARRRRTVGSPFLPSSKRRCFAQSAGSLVVLWRAAPSAALSVALSAALLTAALEVPPPERAGQAKVPLQATRRS
eukprot:CAMPEP_0115364076 /NCGR_PEP_ID=MMETSP0270-20121206/103567_1 /TAXON_ID=71861 /ORGANISM="Scrippsiella trochoidea, Strain CCMP3099" /LENGTH=77 /DNA_ID=CAMNT_0002786733 /DNA_START=549 /DNA_END=782 /DNA_ORIENTATION=+